MNTIDAQINLLQQTRKNILEEVDTCTTEQLFRIPDGFNNNILWNVAHLVATMDILIYSSSNTPSTIDQSLVQRFKKGTAPEGGADEAFVEEVLHQFEGTLDLLRSDYNNKVFGPYTERTTSYGVTLASVEDAIFFCNLHESMHYGQIKMLRRLVS